MIRFARGAFRRLLIVALACFIALFAAVFCVSAAHADQGAVTRTIGGVNYTLPSDWVQTDVPVEMIEGVEVGEVVAFSKHDACFVAFHAPKSAGEYVSINEFEELAAFASAMLAGTPFESVVISAQIEQGCPALTFYTDALVFNDVTYAITVKVFAVDTDVASDAVFMLSFLPADGVLHEDLLALFSYSEEPQEIELASVAYDLPGSVALGKGSVFDFEFLIAFGEEGGLLGFDVPELADDGYLTVSDLSSAVSEMLPELEYQFAEQGIDDVVDGLWMGAYAFVGFPTVGLEFLVDLGEGIQAYICSTANITPSGTAFLMLAQPADSPFASSVLGSARAIEDQSDEPSVETGLDSPATDGDELGFVIGVR